MDAAEPAELCFPQLFNSSCRKPPAPPSTATAVLVHVLLSFASVLTAVLNMLVIISISHFRQLHTSTNLLLLSLAVSDFLVGLLLMPVEILSSDTCWLLGDAACALYYIVTFIITSSSVGSAVLISIDRYLAVCDPLHYPNRVTLNRTKVCICLCWVCSSIYNTTLILRNFLRQSDSHSACRGECVVILSNATVTVDFVVNFSAPITVIIILYLRVFAVAVSQAQAMRSHVAAHQRSLAVKKSELKAAKTLGVVVVVFVICLCPYYAPTFIGQGVEENTFTSSFVVWLAYLNSCLNPLIYTMFYPWFRKSIKIIVTLQILKPNSRHAKIM
ncbi:trace amine-associated receptor 8a-like [Salarias fasciatus]|nr:trace amine-associated receptor 8a-like [Salarias fasciatus]